MTAREALEIAVQLAMKARNSAGEERQVSSAAGYENTAAVLRRLIPFVEANLLYWQFVDAGAEHQRNSQGPLCLALYRAFKEGA